MAPRNEEYISSSVLNSKLDTLTGTMLAHVARDDKFQDDLTEAINGCEDYPGIRGRLDRLERTTAFAQKILWTLITALIAIGVAVLTGRH